MVYTRILTSGSIAPAFIGRASSVFFNGSTTYTYGSNVLVQPSFKYRSTKGVDTVGFYRRKRAGELLPFTPFEQVEISLECTTDLHNVHLKSTTSNSYYQATTGSFGGTVTGVCSSDGNLQKFPRPPRSAATQALQLQAMAGFYKSGFDLGTFIAELNETKRLLLGAASRLRSLLKRKMAVEDSWLEYRYGWRLLYYDLLDIQKLVVKLSDATPRFSTYRVGKSGNAPSQTASYDNTKLLASLPGALVKCPATYSTYSTYNERVSVVSKTAPPKILFDPYVTAYEMVSWSFVLDWFFSLGDWIAAQRLIAVNREVVLGYGSFETFEVRNVSSQCYRQYQDYFVDSGNLADDFSYSYSKTVRIPLTSVPVPGFRLRLGFANVVDSLALLRSLVWRKLRR